MSCTRAQLMRTGYSCNSESSVRPDPVRLRTQHVEWAYPPNMTQLRLMNRPMTCILDYLMLYNFLVIELNCNFTTLCTWLQI